MLYSGEKFLAMALLAVGLVFASQLRAQAATTVYTDNISKTTAGAESASGTRRLTSSFTTGSEATYLQSITLLLANPTSGAASLSVYTNGLLSPSTLVGTLTSPASFTSGTSETTFNASGIPLAAGTTYWVVLRVNSGTFNWSWTTDNTGTGTGYTHTWGESDDAGASWQTYNVHPLQMRVTVSSSDTTAAGVIQFSAASYSVGEGDGSVAITVTRTGDTNTAATVEYDTSDVTASDRTDYNAASGTLSFAAGETTKSFNVFVTDDAFVEGNEALNVTLTNASNATLGAQASTTVTIVDNDTTVAATNPVDSAQFFVRQHYVDFLNREPDAAGLAFWTNEITQCGTDTTCTGIKRVNVSGAFFLSIEFQQTGYLVYKTYGAAFGTTRVGSTVPLTLAEFLPDVRRLGQNFVVGSTGWEAQLEANKAAYFDEFVTRAAFASAYPSGMTAAQYVDALNTNAGGALSTAERNQLVADLTAATKTRAQVLRAVVEDSDFNAAQFNRAFVLMQYFGYLRRDPNATPDVNFDGYNFWLSKLNQFGGNYVSAEMVKAFLQADEYRKRFGQQ
jgi:precorrin-6B methylase 2